MFSRHNAQGSGDERSFRDESRGSSSPLPATGVREVTPTPAVTEAPMAAAPAPTIRTETESQIGRDDRFEGTLRVQKGLRILGQVQGSIEATTSVTIEEGARVDADLTTDEAIIRGEYSGKLVCRQRLEIGSTGLVKGEIETVRLMLHEGGFIDGALHMQKPGSSGSSTAEMTRAESIRVGYASRMARASEPEAPEADEADAETQVAASSRTTRR